MFHYQPSSVCLAVFFAALPVMAVEKHAQMAKEFEKSPAIWEQKFPMSGRPAAHCRRLAEKLAKQAEQGRAKAGQG